MTTTWAGGAVGAVAQAVLAPNPGPMTLEGTNTWVLRAPGSEAAIVVDPGPEGHTDHLRAVAEAAGPVALTILTHHHRDHTGAVAEWAAMTGSPVRGADHGAPFADGERIQAAGLTVQVLLTPGHTDDSISLLVQDHNLLLTGDTVLGRGTTVVPWPEGDLGAYLTSLDRLADLARVGKVESIAPGHGPVIQNPLEFLTELIAHRRQRLEQVTQALNDGATSAADVVQMVYGDLAKTLARAALSTVRAQLAYLGRETD
ncbi:MAG TPA: MBL fold metallo-hydrolase [Actinomycetaceae bacterium]|nr:MBL fold metallo-hydrolase [Actinomycetaceae bacterium]